MPNTVESPRPVPCALVVKIQIHDLRLEQLPAAEGQELLREIARATCGAGHLFEVSAHRVSHLQALNEHRRVAQHDG
jgi:hypothetical protein